MVSALLHPAGPLASRCVGWRPSTGSRALAGPSNGARVFARAGNWLPGSPPRPWLPDDMVGNYGYDPLGLGKNASNLKQFQQGEIINARWAMLGVAGMFGAEFLGQGDWVEAPLWAVKGGQAQYLGRTIPLNLKSLAVIELVLIGGAEGLRLTDTDETRKIYPGGPFDPFGLSKDPEQFEDLKLKELQNGRLAMFAFVGFVSQYIATGKGPVANLYDHIADPWGTNFATNGYSLPF